MVGHIVKHSGFGLGRILAVQPNLGRIVVNFFATNETHTLTGGLHRVPLPLETHCQTEQGACRIKSRKLGTEKTERHLYLVEFEDGRVDEISEENLTPKEDSASTTSPGEALLQLAHEGLGTFQCRETLLNEWLRMLRGGRGVSALLSSRIDLRPHQAYVAGVVMLDRVQRYLLADEVGLGKTIEAGIVIHDLLGRKPDARIIIICPGALTRQWLCELYSKFSGQAQDFFSLPEIHPSPKAILKKSNHVILSFHGAKEFSSELLATHWDLVVIDEAHHLLGTTAFYEVVRALSIQTRGILLLSALPAQHREEEYLRLLALLEPDHYDLSRKGEAERFRELYARQRDLGTRLRWIARKAPLITGGEEKAETVMDKIRDLAAWPVLNQDPKLQALVTDLDVTSGTYNDRVKAFLYYVGDTHRITRRILRNRRARLIQESQIKAIQRRLNRLEYRADQLELDAVSFVRRFLLSLQSRKLREAVLLPLSRQLFQACCDPHALVEMLESAAQLGDEGEIELDDEDLELDALGGYDDWHVRLNSLWRATLPLIDQQIFCALQTAARSWMESPESRCRFGILVSFLKKSHRADQHAKFVIFAGFPGAAERLANDLSKELSRGSVSRFHHGLDDSEKEEEG
jgi:ATP-dependent helicase HepA